MSTIKVNAIENVAGTTRVGVDQIGVGGFKNKLINGCFKVWQRATSQTSSGMGTSDRWYNWDTSTNKTTTREAFTAGQTDVPGNPSYYSRTVITTTSGASSAGAMGQYIEDVDTLSGEVVTMSFWAKTDVAKNIALSFDQDFGSGGSSTVSTHAGKFALTTSWAKYSITLTIPSVAGKTIGSSSSLQPWLWWTAGSDYDTDTSTLGIQTGTFDIAQIQLERGNSATPFEDRPIAVEEVLCHRYYQQVYVNQFSAVIYLPNGDTRGNDFYFSKMRGTPSISPSSFSTHSINFSTSGEAVNAPTVTWNVAVNSTGGNHFSFECGTANADWGGNNYVVIAGSHCNIGFKLDAEL